MKNQIDLIAYRAELQQKLAAVDLLLGRNSHNSNRNVLGVGARRGPKPGSRKMSAAAKARLSAIARARWAKAKKAGKNAL